jgi:hypothetical protein
LWREKKEQSNRKEVGMASFSKTPNVILSSGLATQGIMDALAETNVGYYRWFDGAQDTLVGLFGMLQRERAAIDESHMARLFVLSLKSADIGKAEALLNGEIPPANNDAKPEALAEQVAALTKALAQQAEKTSK